MVDILDPNQLPNQINPDPSLPAPEPTLPKRKISIFFVICIPILLIILGIITYVMLQARTMYQESVVVASPSPTPQASTNPTEGWQSYANTQYGFSFKYPNTSTDEPNPTSGSDLTIIFHKLTSFKYTELWLYVGKKFIFTHSTNDIGQNITIDGVAATRWDIPAGQNPAQTLIEIKHGKDFITLQLAKEDKDNLINPMFDQILGSFKFTTNTASDDESTLITTVQNKVFDYGKNHGLTSKDQVIIDRITIVGNYAVGNTSFTSEVEGSGNIWYATKINNQWVVVEETQEPASCNIMTQYNFPKSIYGECVNK